MQNVYRALAERLNALPNGFPATESGVELKILAKMFTPEEAALAAVMNLEAEPAADIAARAGVELNAARKTLKQMVRHGLIYAGRGEGELTYGLLPFIVGSYEAQLPRMDAEFAALFEQYFQESGRKLLQHAPSVHRVIPIEQAIDVSLEVYPYERAVELIENAQSWAVRDCICRVQQKLIGKGCDAPVNNCLSFAPLPGAFDHDPTARVIDKQEALQILQQAAQAGLVHTAGNYRYGNHYICNCCTCCCGVLRGVAELGMPTAIAHSDFYAQVDADTCIGCGNCISRCRFAALSMPASVSTVDVGRCVGCGLCVPVCPIGALSLHRRSAEHPDTPENLMEWMHIRAQNRGLTPLRRAPE